MISNDIKQKILEKAILLNKYGMNDLTWEKEEAKGLITSLIEEDIGILGGSVYKIDSNSLIPMYDNWSYVPTEKETLKEFYLGSKVKAIEYINKYPVYKEEKILFSLVFTEDVN